MRILHLLSWILFLTGMAFGQQASTISGCPSFPANNVWNTPVNQLPVHAHSSDYIASITANDGLRYDTSMPINIVPGTQPKVAIRLPYPDESDPGPYPIPANAQVEPGGDAHVIVVDKDNCILYELYNSVLQGDGSWLADNASKWDLRSNALRPAGWTSADAAGLPIMPGVLRYAEMLSGQINHALRFTAPHSQHLYVWPGRHYASSNTSPLVPPMGQRFRLKAGFNVSGYSANMQVILRAIQKYGIILADNGLPWFLQADPDPRWDSDELDTLRTVLGSNIEAVDESSLMIDPDSGQAVQSSPSVSVASVTVSSGSVVGGIPVGVTVTLTAAAPTGGALITLTGSGPAFPSTSVTVAGGSVSQAFSLPTATVGTPTVVTVSASYNGSSATSAGFTVNPANVLVTIASNPVGLQVIVDGTSYSAPQIFNWVAGSTHSLNTVTPQTVGNARYSLTSWSDSGSQSHTIVTPASAGAITANFTAQYLLTRTASPSTAGTVTANPASGDGYYATGTNVQLTASPASGCVFTGFTGDLSGSGNPQNLSMSAPKSITANFSCTSGTPPPGGSALQFIPITPCRIMDTRGNGFTGAFGPSSLAASVSRDVPILSSPCGIPSTAKAYALNLTVLPKAGALGYLSVWPAGQAQPMVSTLNSWDGSVLANAAIVPAGTNGAISVFATNAADVVIDINGYFALPSGNSLAFYPLAPCRVADTRNPSGPFGGPFIAGGSSRAFSIPSSSCGAPSSARAYSLNVTAVPKGGLFYVTAWPTGQPQPMVSTLNSFDGTTLANAAIVPAGTNGAVSFYASNDTDLVVDINGYFAPPGAGGLNFYTTTPCRVADTRNASGTLGGPTLNAGQSRSFPVPQSSCGVPSSAGAYSLNMTVVPSQSLYYLSVWPTGAFQPLVSTLNAFKGMAVANAALVPAGSNGAISAYVSNSSDLIIDINGYFGQ